MKNITKKLIGIIIGLVIIVSSCIFLYFCFISFPSTKSIARQYLDAIISEDFEAAFELGRSRLYCQDTLRDSISMDIEKYGGAEVTGIEIEIIGHSGGSDNQLQFADISFNYLHTNQDEWQKAEMRLGTDHDVPGFRYLLCGNSLNGP
jgi:hypothetical protein